MTSIAAGVAVSNAHQKTKTIYRDKHDRENPYTVISNRLLRDNTIKLADIGLLAQILSWSDYHNICIKALTKKCLEGREAIRNSLDRLITAGYISAVQTRSNDGTFDKTVYTVFERSQGAINAVLDLDGMKPAEETPQMDLFGDEEMQNEKDTAIGFSVNGKVETNKYDDVRSNLNNNNPSANLENSEQPKTKAELLKIWHKDLNDPVFKARLCMGSLHTFLLSQEQLDQFLIDFNQQHERFKHLTENQRLNNFLAYLNKIRYSKQEQMKHLARLRAHGFIVGTASIPSQKDKKPNDRLQQAINGCNPHETKPDANISPTKAWLDDLEDF